MKLLIIVFLAVSTLLVTNKSEVSAKESGAIVKCAIPSFTRAYQDSNAIFAGKVINVRTEGDERIFTLQVEKYWKGKKSKTLEVRYYETSYYQAWLKVGGRYLVFARKNDNGTLSDSRCSLTKDYSQASAELKKLGKGKLVK